MAAAIGDTLAMVPTVAPPAIKPASLRNSLRDLVLSDFFGFCFSVPLSSSGICFPFFDTSGIQQLLLLKNAHERLLRKLHKQKTSGSRL
jgi:hypothetical protein